MEPIKHCEFCDRELKPCPARFDGVPTFVGFFPCACTYPLMTDTGVTYPGDSLHEHLLQTGKYSINDILTKR